MPAGNTYEAIATQTLGSAAASVTFSSISGSYTDLIIICNMSNTVGGIDFTLRFNGDTGTNYSKTQLYGTGSAAGSNNQSGATFFGGVGIIGTTIGTSIVHLNNYSNTTTNKTILVRSNSDSFVMANVGLWRNTSAINQIEIGTLTNNISTGSTFSLYGVLNA
jgi:hypothetical protein